MEHPLPYTIAGLGHTYAVAGEIKQAEAVLDELRNSSKQKHVPAYDLAVTYAGLGERDDAFACLEKAYQERSGWLTSKVEPRLDSLRSDKPSLFFERKGTMGTNRRSAIWERVSPDRGRIAVYAFVSVLALAAVLSVGARLILGQEGGHNGLSSWTTQDTVPTQ